MTNKSMKSILGKFVLMVFFSAIMFSVSSCLVLAGKDNGKHKGWFKNQKHPKKPRHNKPGKGNEFPMEANSLVYSKFPAKWVAINNK